MQHTLKTATDFIKGPGLHTGAEVCLRILPAMPGTGLQFVRTDLASVNTYVPAHYSAVDTQASRLCTYLKNDAGVAVQTPEHLMAALAGCGIDNALIEINGPEVPLMDGSAKPFADAIMAVGRKLQPANRKQLQIVKPVRVQDGNRYAEIIPSADAGLTIDFTIDFPGIGEQQSRFALTDAKAFMQVADSRTFTTRSVAEKMKAAGLVKGGSLDNALVIDDIGFADGTATSMFVNKPRYKDEPVRHKIMDAVGDLALAGMPIQGEFTCYCGGHALTNMLLRAVFADQNSYRVVEDLAGIPVPQRKFTPEHDAVIGR